MDISCLSEKEKKEIIRYGMKRTRSICISIAITLLLGWAFQIFLQSTIFLISFICLRRFAGGYHASTQGRCYILSLGILINVFLLMKYAYLHSIIFVAAQTVNYLVLLVLVPVDCVNHKLEQWEKDKFGRKARIISTVIYILCLLFLMSKAISVAIAIGMANLVTGGCVVAGYIQNLWRRKFKIDEREVSPMNY